MQRELFEQEIYALLPEVSADAMKNWMQYAKELDQDGTESEKNFYDSVYVELSLIKYHQGEKVAKKLFDYAERFTFNPFELRGAATLLCEGWSLDRIADYAVENGCDPTCDEFEESKAVLKVYQEDGEDPIRYLERRKCLPNRSQFSRDIDSGAKESYGLEHESPDTQAGDKNSLALS